MSNVVSEAKMKTTLLEMGKVARAAAEELAVISAEVKAKALCAMANAIRANAAEIMSVNREDTDRAAKNGLSAAMIDRLTLTPARVESMAQGLETVAAQSDPVGKIISETTRPNGLKIRKVSVPFGVIGIIYESRPNVTADSAGICIKSGNAVILRGGSEAFESNTFIAKLLNQAAVEAGLPDGTLQILPWTTHAAVPIMLGMDRYIDLVIPRGGENLIRSVMRDATMPVLKHYKGVCHIFVDRKFDAAKAVEIIVNAKCQRPSACNALETLLIDREVAPDFIPQVAAALAAKGVEMRGDEEFRKYYPEAKAATEDDYFAEYLDLILTIRVVDGVKAAVDHINHYGSRHSDGIISDIKENIDYFLSRVDSSCCYANASTRFTDGGEFGMGAEIGISTDKLHARGPMGADELTSYKYLIYGDGQIRQG